MITHHDIIVTISGTDLPEDRIIPMEEALEFALYILYGSDEQRALSSDRKDWADLADALAAAGGI